MSLLTNIYHRTIAENEKNIKYWEDYVNNLKQLDFSTFSNKLKVPVLVPIGSRILFRGELKHTNEVTVALGADYFAKCSLAQAEILRQHRIKTAEQNLESFRKEKEYLEKQISFTNENIFGKDGKEIIEVHTEEQDKAWREKHRENVRKWKQQKKTEPVQEEKLTDEDLWNRLEELELQEELENEMRQDNYVVSDRNSFVIKEESSEAKLNRDDISQTDAEDGFTDSFQATMAEKKLTFAESEPLKVAGKFELLQKVMDKQIELEERLLELKNKDRNKSKTEQDLIAKLDEMEELEDLQDEMDRIEDIIEEEDVASESSEGESSSISVTSAPKRRVSFADEDERETLELNFHHSDVESCTDPYDPEKGIQKPSDIYQAFSQLFPETTSILKKSKYLAKNTDLLVVNEKAVEKESIGLPQPKDKAVQNTTIEVKDIIERNDININELNTMSDKRPASLFKQRRQQKKK